MVDLTFFSLPLWASNMLTLVNSPGFPVRFAFQALGSVPKGKRGPGYLLKFIRISVAIRIEIRYNDWIGGKKKRDTKEGSAAPIYHQRRMEDP